MDKAPLPRLSCEPLISDQNYCLQQYSLLDVPKLSPACRQAFYLRLPDLPSMLKRCPALLFLQTEQWLGAWIWPAPSPDIIFRLCQLWGSNIASWARVLLGGCVSMSSQIRCPESHSRSGLRKGEKQFLTLWTAMSFSFFKPWGRGVRHFVTF